MTLRSALRRILPVAQDQHFHDAPDLLTQFRALMATSPPTAPTTGTQLLRVGIATFGAGVNHLVVDCLTPGWRIGTQLKQPRIVAFDRGAWTTAWRT